MEQPQSSAAHRKQLVVVAFLAALFGFAAGFQLARMFPEGPEAPELPCPTCRIEREQNSDICRLVGQINPAWPLSKSPLVRMSLSPADGKELFQPGDCFSIPISCPGPTEQLEFKHSSSSQLFGNSWCTSDCQKKMNC